MKERPQPWGKGQSCNNGQIYVPFLQIMDIYYTAMAQSVHYLQHNVKYRKFSTMYGMDCCFTVTIHGTLGRSGQWDVGECSHQLLCYNAVAGFVWSSWISVVLMLGFTHCSDIRSNRLIFRLCDEIPCLFVSLVGTHKN